MAEPEPPEALALLRRMVARFNPGDLRRYPGSPVVAAEALRRNDRLIACELRTDDYDRLRQALAKYPNAKAAAGDGFAMVCEEAGATRLLVLIDPPFERPDDYEQAGRALDAVLQRNRSATVAIWLPLKDLETFDGFLRRLEAPGALIVELRLRPLIDPMKMNGCALVIANAPPGLETPLGEAGAWIVGAAGEKGGETRIWSLGT